MVTITETRADTPASECFLRATFPEPFAWVIVTVPTPAFKTALTLSKRHTRKRWWSQDLPPVAPTGQTGMLRNTAYLLRLTRVRVRKL